MEKRAVNERILTPFIFLQFFIGVILLFLVICWAIGGLLSYPLLANIVGIVVITLFICFLFFISGKIAWGIAWVFRFFSNRKNRNVDTKSEGTTELELEYLVLNKGAIKKVVTPEERMALDSIINKIREAEGHKTYVVSEANSLKTQP